MILLRLGGFTQLTVSFAPTRAVLEKYDAFNPKQHARVLVPLDPLTFLQAIYNFRY
jgi:hypothetical protein